MDKELENKINRLYNDFIIDYPYFMNYKIIINNKTKELDEKIENKNNKKKKKYNRFQLMKIK